MPATVTAPDVCLNPPPIVSLCDDRITQREAAKLLNVSFPTASRYMNAGRHGIRIPSAKVGGKRTTTREAVAWWFEAVQAAEAAKSGAPAATSQNTETADIESAADAAGL